MNGNRVNRLKKKNLYLEEHNTSGADLDAGSQYIG